MTKLKNFKKFHIFFSSSDQIGFYLIMAFKLKDMMKMFHDLNADSIAAKIFGCNNNVDMELVLEKLKHKIDGLGCLILLDDVCSESHQDWDQLLEIARSIVIQAFIFSTKYEIQT
ncbi:hypothetical protein MTR_2g079250 [Medicago truncatula]|uniref:Uncharacterized protein n=1 Tax=Medicago truncatula TaxID=3880 RepID=A0A072VBB3_MEDTR|nr:hypothetical protein MTR_2g079250 [Medicago truncatula]